LNSLVIVRLAAIKARDLMREANQFALRHSEKLERDLMLRARDAAVRESRQEFTCFDGAEDRENAIKPILETDTNIVFVGM
jgi:hypothetical protein